MRNHLLNFAIEKLFAHMEQIVNLLWNFGSIIMELAPILIILYAKQIERVAADGYAFK